MERALIAAIAAIAIIAAAGVIAPKIGAGFARASCALADATVCVLPDAD